MIPFLHLILLSAATSLLSDNCHLFFPPTYTCREATTGGRALTKKQAPTLTRASTRLNKGAPIAGDTHSTRSSPRTTTSNTGDPVMLPDLRKPVKK